MKRQLLLLLFSLFLGLEMAQAVPAYPVRKTVRTSNGSEVSVTLRGDEHLSYWLTDDGKALRRQADGTYAQIPTFELQQMREEASDVRLRNNIRRAGRRRVGTITPQTGKKKGLVILVNFKDEKFVLDDPRAEYMNYFNQKGYSNYGMTGSVADYFEAQSYGQFQMEFDVVGPYELAYPLSHYGAPNGNAHDTDAQSMIVEACTMANADVNYSDYDWNHDGKLEQVYVIYNGRGENYTHDDDNPKADGNKNIWPHESSIGRELRLDGVYLSTYACSCELRGVTGTTLDGIGTACHEFSHCLGFPDMYDTSSTGNRYGMGYWDILSAGSYNDNGCTPAGYTSYERWQAGWLTPVEANGEIVVENMKPITESPEAYILYNGRTRTEYYLLENRQLTGFDAGLAGHGLLVLHVTYDADAWSSNGVNSGLPQRMTIIPADGRLTYASESGDPFPGIRNVTSLTDYTEPAATLNIENSDGTLLMHKPIENIRESADGLLSFYLCREPLGVPQVSVSNIGDTSFTATWPAVKRATSYELSLTGIPSKKNPADAIVLEETFAGTYKSSQGLSDISGKLSQYLDTKGFTGEQLYQSPSLLRFGTSSKAGTLKSPVQQALSTTKLTIVLQLVPFTEGTTVKGTVSVVTNTQPKEDIAIDLKTAQTLVIHPQLALDEIFRVDITASTRMYIQHMTLYDGQFTAQELGLTGNVVEKVRRRAETKTLTTSETSYTFTDLDPTYDYELSVRAKDAISESLWSEVVKVAARATGIEKVADESPAKGTNVIYDLSGRRVSAPTRHGIYIVNGRKVAF